MTEILDRLFAFPVIMFDAENEEHKRKLGLPGDEEIDMIEGEVEYPYHDFNGIGERWLPTEESLQRAKKGKFDACSVTFINVGTLLVPWTKDKFKRELKKFIESLNIEPERNITLLLTTDKGNIREIKDGEDGKPAE